MTFLDNAITWKKDFQHAISWKWTALKEFNSLGTKSVTVFFQESLLTYQIVPVSAEMKLTGKNTLVPKMPNMSKKWIIITSTND